MKQINVLVTGCGGDIGQSVGKVLRDFAPVANVYGTDLHMKHAGLFIFDECYLVPRANDPEYMAAVKTLVEKLSIDLVIPVTEYELAFFAKNGIDAVGIAKLVKPNDHIIKLGLDKWQTAEALKQLDLPSPTTLLAGEAGEEVALPVIIKSRTGSGSKQVAKVTDQETLGIYLKWINDPILQEYIPDEQGEYTCGLYRSATGVVRSIQVKRELMGGFTGYGEVINEPAIANLLERIATGFDLKGSINVQLRLKGKVPLVFEINPRFSSTVRFRDLMGFKDVIWAVQETMGWPLADYTAENQGARIYKGFSEYLQMPENG